jgi:FkbM family methyltransferase
MKRSRGLAVLGQRMVEAVRNPRFVAGRFLWRSRLCQRLTIETPLYRLRFFPTALSCALWTDPGSRRSDDQFFREYLRPGDTVVDVGANVGTLTLTAAALVGPAGAVFSIEAHPRTFEFLRANLALNPFTNVTPIQAAAGEEAGVLRFTDGRLDDQNHVSTGAGALEVPVKRLDDLVFAATVRLLKIDVEGFELFVLRGAPKLLARTDCVYFECGEEGYGRYGYRVADVTRLLQGAGFSVYERREQALSPFVALRRHHQNLVALRLGSPGSRRLEPQVAAAS